MPTAPVADAPIQGLGPAVGTGSLALINAKPTTASTQAAPTTVGSPTTPAPTVITNADLSSNIAKNTATLTKASNTGVSTGPNGPQYANGTLVPGSSTNTDATPPQPTFGVDSGSTPTGEVRQVKDGNGNIYSIDSNGQIVSGGSTGQGANSNQYQVGANISSYPDLYKTITGKDLSTVPVGGSSGGVTGDATTDALLQQMDDITARGDARTASTIQGIKDQYTSLINAQKEVNRQQQGSITQSLLMGGSSRYAGASSAGVTAAVVSSGIDKIATLTSQENNLINQAQAAQDDADYKNVQTKLSEYQKVVAAKQAETAKLNATLATANQKLQDQKAQVAKDNAIHSIMATGVTDPGKVLDELQKQGYTNISAKDIADTMKNLASSAGITPDGLTGDIKEYFTLKNSGIPLPASITALPPAQQPYAYVAYKADLARKATAAGTDKSYTMTTDQKGQLIGTGLTNDEVNHLQEGINEYGLSEVLSKETGLTQNQKDVLTTIVTNKAKQFIDENYIKKTFDADALRKIAKDSGDTTGGFLGFGTEGNLDDYVKTVLMPTVELYRDQGLSDKDIFTKLENKVNGK